MIATMDADATLNINKAISNLLHPCEDEATICENEMNFCLNRIERTGFEFIRS